MKKKEDNSFQLLFTALVLVVIAVGGTLAWFASNSTASVNQIAASVTRPSDVDSFDGKPIEEWNGSSFVNFGTGRGLYVPGMKRLFRVAVNSTESTAVLVVLDGEQKPTLGNAIRIKFFNQNPTVSGSQNYWLDVDYTQESTMNYLAASGTYGWTITHSIPANNNSQFIYFALYMDNVSSGAENSYQGTDFDFQVGVVNPQS